jgi:hypothetical protein
MYYSLYSILAYIGDLAEDNYGPPQYSEESLVEASLLQVQSAHRNSWYSKVFLMMHWENAKIKDNQRGKKNISK